MVCALTPPSWTTELAENPEPAKVRIESAEPETMPEGDRLERTGATVYVLPVMVEVAEARLLEAFGSVSEPLTCAVRTALPAAS